MSTLKEKLRHQLRLILLSIPITIFLVLIVPILAILLLLARWTVSLCAKLFQPHLDQIVGSQGALQAHDNFSGKIESNTLITLFWSPIQNGGEIENLRHLFQERVIQKSGKRGELIYPGLQQYWTEYLNFTFWAFDKTFNLKNHIRNYDYDGDLKLPPGTCDENHLRKIMAGLTSIPWTKGRSPWEILIIKNYELKAKAQEETSPEIGGKTQTVWILRFHHGMGDGYSFYRMLARDLFQMDGKDWPLQVNFKKMNMIEKIVQKLVFPFRLAYDFATASLESSDGINCWHLMKPKCGDYCTSFVSEPIPVEKIKSIKTKFGVSYKSVIYCAFIRTAKRLMKDAGQEIPNDVAAISPFPRLDSGRPEGTVNYFSPAYFKLPVQLKDANGSDYFDTNAVAHLQATFKRMDKSKYFTAPTTYFYLMKFLLTGPNFMNRLVAGRIRCTLNLNCLQGPKVAPKFLDMELDLALVGHGTPGEVGITTLFLSLNGKQSVSATIDRSAFPSQELFTNFEKYLKQEIETLYEQTKIN